jgi:hypothetical protein
VVSDSTALAASVEIVDGVNAGKKTSTDDSGRYQFPGLAPGTLVVRASAAGYAAQTASLTLDSDKTADFTLAKVVTPTTTRGAVSGVVTNDATGQPLPGARVEITVGSNRGRSTSTDDSGRYTLGNLELEAITVEVTAPGFLARTRSLTVDEDTTVADFRLQPAPVAPAFATPGRVVDVLTGRGLAGVTVKGTDVSAEPSDASGALQIGSATSSSSLRQVLVSGAGIVERETHVHVPGEDVVVTVIPASFDLAAFDQMFRGPELRRWTTAPPLVIEQRVLQFTDVDMQDAIAAPDVMTTAHVDGLVADLTWALPQLTGGRYTAFDTVTRKTAADGERVHLLTSGVITVVWVAGLTNATGSWGWSRWLYDMTGTVLGGLVLLDRDFERSTSPYRRALRAHELGHALGYAHVTARTSVMNASARLEPNSFDRDATKIAFDRRPGSRSPDIDPAPDRAPQRAGRPIWTPAVP